MEYKHFSHPHGLTLSSECTKIWNQLFRLQVPLLSEKAYVCWECNFFLHGQCFHAIRSIDHPSHQTHSSLTLVPYPTYPSGCFICNFCNKPGFGFSFGCSKCEYEYDLHLHCSNINTGSSTTSRPSPSQSQLQQINHNSHPKHALRLLSSPPYTGGAFICSACGEDGKDSVYNCRICEFDLHEKCAALPENVKRNDHAHHLVLSYSMSSPYYTCDVCWLNIPGDLWMYMKGFET